MNSRGTRKSLFVCPAGKIGKEFVQRTVARFGHDNFDILLLVYDGTPFDEAGFAGCTVIHDELPLFWRLRRYVTPELSLDYEFIFIWMDDIDVLEFDPQSFLHVLRKYSIEVGHPALASDSVICHPVMERHPTDVGRYTDFAEPLAWTIRADLWGRFWELIEPDRNPWGWGYDEVAYAVCRFRKTAIIDSEVVRHTRKGDYHASAKVDHDGTLARHVRFYRSRKKTLCTISDHPWYKRVLTPLWLHLHFAWARSFSLPGALALRRFIRAMWVRARRSIT